MARRHVERTHRQVGVVVRHLTARWRLGVRVFRHREQSMGKPEKLRSLEPPPVVTGEVWPLRRYLNWHADARRYYTYDTKGGVNKIKKQKETMARSLKFYSWGDRYRAGNFCQ